MGVWVFLSMSCYAVLSVQSRESWLLYLTVFLLTFGYKCSVPFPYSAMSWSALSNCGISCSYSLTFWSFLVYYY